MEYKMNRNIFSKGLAVAVIVLFIGLAIQPSVAVQPETEIDIEPEQDIVSEPSGLLWGTYKDCEIYGEFWVNGFYMLRYMLFTLLFRSSFIAIFSIWGLNSGTLNGAKGEVDVHSVIGFGFTGDITPCVTSRDPGVIDGHLQFCMYLKDIN